MDLTCPHGARVAIGTRFAMLTVIGRPVQAPAPAPLVHSLATHPHWLEPAQPGFRRLVRALSPAALRREAARKPRHRHDPYTPAQRAVLADECARLDSLEHHRA